MDKSQAAHDIITHALPLVAFEGWTQSVLAKAAMNAGYKKTDAIRVFPGGAVEAVDAFFIQADRQMCGDLQRYNLDTMKIRERVTTAVWLWLEAHEKHREALRKAVALHAMPMNAHHAAKDLYRTVDAIWYAIGDTSTDFNFYTKRLLLAGVLSSTLLVWLDDKTPGHTLSRDFLERRIADVMQIEKAKAKLKSWLGSLPVRK